MLQFSIESSRVLGPCASYLNSLALGGLGAEIERSSVRDSVLA